MALKRRNQLSLNTGTLEDFLDLSMFSSLKRCIDVQRKDPFRSLDI